MNKFFFLVILFGLGSVASIGLLSNDFAVIVQKLGIFHTADVGLTGCTCVNAVTGIPETCDPALTSYQLCIPKPPP